MNAKINNECKLFLQNLRLVNKSRKKISLMKNISIELFHNGLKYICTWLLKKKNTRKVLHITYTRKIYRK